MTDDLIRREDALDAMNSVALTYGATWEPHSVKLCKDAISAIPAVQVAAKPLDLSYVQKHAFLAGVVSARNVPPNQPCSGPLLWLDYDPGNNPALSSIRSALTAQPSPDVAALVKALVDALEFYADRDNYEPVYERMPCDCCTEIYEPVKRDEGDTARAALAAWKGGAA